MTKIPCFFPQDRTGVSSVAVAPRLLRQIPFSDDFRLSHEQNSDFRQSLGTIHTSHIARRNQTRHPDGIGNSFIRPFIHPFIQSFPYSLFRTVDRSINESINHSRNESLRQTVRPSLRPAVHSFFLSSSKEFGGR